MIYLPCSRTSYPVGQAQTPDLHWFNSELQEAIFDNIITSERSYISENSGANFEIIPLEYKVDKLIETEMKI